MTSDLFGINFPAANQLTMRAMSMFANYEASGAGIIAIPQEGKSAGVPQSEVYVSDASNTKFAKNVCDEIGHGFEQGQVSNSAFWKKFQKKHGSSMSYCVEAGNFGTPLVVVWIDCHVESDVKNDIEDLAKFAVFLLEISKKSAFHSVLSNALIEFDEHGIFTGISEAIEIGLYCSQVLVWEVRQDQLIGRNESANALDLLVGNSLAGETVLTGHQIKIDDFDTDNRIHQVEYKDWLKKKGHRAAVFLPIHGQFGILGVVGIFYKRAYGATAIDIELAEYICAYFERLWEKEAEKEEAELRLLGLTEFEGIYLDVLRCLTDLHDMPSILSSAQHDLLQAKPLSHSIPEVVEYIDRTNQSLDLIAEIVDPHTSAITFARDHYQRLLESGSIATIGHVDVAYIVNREVSLYQNYFKANKIDVTIDIESYPKRIKYAVTDFASIIRNLLQNSARSLAGKTHTRRKINVVVSFRTSVLMPRDIDIEVSVWDNGQGVRDDLQKKVFEPGVSTYKNVGGKGMGLAIIDRIAQSNGAPPELKSTWGSYCEIRAVIKGKIQE